MAPRSKKGCISCRIRRVKCDETKPHCLRCQTSRRVCDGYLDDAHAMSRRQLAHVVRNLSVIGPVARALSQSPPSDAVMGRRQPVAIQDYVYFDLFRSVTAPATDAFIPSDFWHHDLLQLAHAEPAVWHATLALGALHQRWDLAATTDKDALIRTAIKHYAAAMAQAKNLDSPAKLLALTLPLIAAANMLGFWNESHTHILSALRLLTQNAPTSPESRRIAFTLSRMDMLSMTFSDSKAPYPFDASAALYSPVHAHLRQGNPFQSYSEASGNLFLLLREIMLTDESLSHTEYDPAAYAAARSDVKQRLVEFEGQMAAWEARQTDPSIASAAISIRIYHALMRLIMHATLSASECSLDLCLGYFERIVALSSAFLRQENLLGRGKLHLSLESAVIMPLWDSGKRCRHPVLRRAALRLLRNTNRHEGMWRSDGAAKTVEAIIATEEGQQLNDDYMVDDRYVVTKDQEAAAIALPWDAWVVPGFHPQSTYTWEGFHRIPETSRVRDVLVLSRFDHHELDLRLLMCSGDPTIPYGPAKDLTIKLY
ncbi:hypothetical protein B0I35DRAFT_387889 [Stachybotrys elegans]|uniref:Zn(2)-C6 fungal-type domain-containing protein n=1 Tax=Stachybotrys elegans TaxID=80388 RepID=A0A8K0T094_9HYPO|nr:hypothetical protein B0I35DRAFT_387889 [Stachybotrys elegans]